MNRKGFPITLITLLALLLGVAATVAVAQEPMPTSPGSTLDALGTTFTYQGQLQRNGSPVDGPCEMAFRLYDDASAGNQVGSAISTTVPISDGLFTVGLDFGPDVFAGDGRWLDIWVKCDGDGDYASLGRQELTATPYALFARSAPWSGVVGLPDGFADGVDDVSAVISGTSIIAGDGLTQVASGDSVTMSVYFGGSGGDYGSAISVARSDHAHDGSYYTETELQTGGSASVHWDNLSSAPSGLDDGDDDTTYTAGTGLALVGTEFSVVTATIQQRVADACGAGYAIREINADGTVTCEPVSVGTGGDYWSLTGNAGTDPGSNFLGTSDNVDLTLAVNGTTALRLEPSGGAPNLIGGYSGNSVSSGVQGAAIGGGGASGEVNRVTDNYGVVGGGYSNQAGNAAGTTSDAAYATVGGGWGNVATGYVATVAGGRYNEATSDSTAIGGGQYNDATAMFATVAGGRHNIVTATYATIAGGWANHATADYVAVGGGYNNDASGDYDTIGGGYNNDASGDYATIGGGRSNEATDNYATIGGGNSNYAWGSRATVGGGSENYALGDFDTVSGGLGNIADGDYATVSGGFSNYAGGESATIPGGYDNKAAGYCSFAAGCQAQANTHGCFVWGDFSTSDDITCDNDNRWVARASGGVYFYTTSTLASGVYLSTGGSSWNAVSDRNRKENFEPVDAQNLLAHLAEIPITTWNYKAQNPAIRHIGPMAQDFNALLPGLGGEGEDYINTLDADGVALAAIQGLIAENAALREQLGDLEMRVAALEAEPTGSASPWQRALLPGVGLFVTGLVWVTRREGITLKLSRRGE